MVSIFSCCSVELEKANFYLASWQQVKLLLPLALQQNIQTHGVCSFRNVPVTQSRASGQHSCAAVRLSQFKGTQNVLGWSETVLLGASSLSPTCASCPEPPAWSCWRWPSLSGCTTWRSPSPCSWTFQLEPCIGRVTTGPEGRPERGCGTAGMLAAPTWTRTQKQSQVNKEERKHRDRGGAVLGSARSPVLKMCLCSFLLLFPPQGFGCQLSGLGHSDTEGVSICGKGRCGLGSSCIVQRSQGGGSGGSEVNTVLRLFFNPLKLRPEGCDVHFERSLLNNQKQTTDQREIHFYSFLQARGGFMVTKLLVDLFPVRVWVLLLCHWIIYCMYYRHAILVVSHRNIIQFCLYQVLKLFKSLPQIKP